MSDKLPDMPDRPLLNTYVQRFMRIGGRIIVVTVIVGLGGGYVGARAWDRGRAETASQMTTRTPVPEPTPVEPTPVEPTPVEPTPVEPTPVEPTRVSWDGRYSGSGGDMNNTQGSFQDVVVSITGGRLSGKGKLTGQTGQGPVSFSGTVSSDGRISGSISGALPASLGSSPSMPLKGSIQGNVDDSGIHLEWSAKCEYVDLFGTLPTLTK